MEYLIVCPLAFIAGFVDIVAGGGGLISLPAYLIAGLPVHTAIGTNKLSSGMGTAITTWQFWKNGYILWKEAARCCIVALFASGLGAGTFLILLLTGLAHMRLDTANGIAKSINLCTNLAGLAVLLIKRNPWNHPGVSYH